MAFAEVELKAPEGIEVIEGVKSEIEDLKAKDLIDWNLEIWLGTFVSLFA